MAKKQRQAPLLPGMGGTLAFGGVQLAPVDLGKPYTGTWMGYHSHQDGQQGSLLDLIERGYQLTEYGDTDAGETER